MIGGKQGFILFLSLISSACHGMEDKRTSLGTELVRLTKEFKRTFSQGNFNIGALKYYGDLINDLQARAHDENYIKQNGFRNSNDYKYHVHALRSSYIKAYEMLNTRQVNVEQQKVSSPKYKVESKLESTHVFNDE